MCAYIYIYISCLHIHTLAGTARLLHAQLGLLLRLRGQLDHALDLRLALLGGGAYSDNNSDNSIINYITMAMIITIIVCVYIYIYIKRERERYREREV